MSVCFVILMLMLGELAPKPLTMMPTKCYAVSFCHTLSIFNAVISLTAKFTWV